MRTYRGSCHCGAVTFSFQCEEITKGERCDCSICARKGGPLTEDTIPRDRIDVTAKPGILGTYQFGTKVAKHHFCRVCGIHTFVESRYAPGEYRVNLGCVDELDAARLPYEIHEGRLE
jgi:hypothetical protein